MSLINSNSGRNCADLFPGVFLQYIILLLYCPMGVLGNFFLTIYGDNDTFVGTLTVTDEDLGLRMRDGNGSYVNGSASANGSSGRFRTEDDPVGASTYVIAVVLIYGVSIVFLIASHVFIKKRESQKDSERQINKYLEQAPGLREKSSRESFRKLKRSIIPLIAQSPTGRELISHKAKYAPYLAHYRPVVASDRHRQSNSSQGAPLVRKYRGRRASKEKAYDPGRRPSHGILKKSKGNYYREPPVMDQDPSTLGYKPLHVARAINGDDSDRVGSSTTNSYQHPDTELSTESEILLHPSDALTQQPLPRSHEGVLHIHNWDSHNPVQIPHQNTALSTSTTQAPETSQPEGGYPYYDLSHENEGGIVSLSESCRSLSSLSIASLTSDSVFDDDSSEDNDFAYYFH